MAFSREEMLKLNIGVLMGGLSTEHKISLQTGEAIYQALRDSGYKAIKIEVNRNLPAELISQKIEVAFNALHGKWGEDGAIQGMLEVMGIKYTGAKVFGSAIAMDKHLSKMIFKSAGLKIADSIILKRDALDDFKIDQLDFDPPYIVKPNTEGSSVGIATANTHEELLEALKKAFVFDEFVMIEQFINGKEIQVAVLDDVALGAIEIIPASEIYDYEAKYLTDKTKYIYPARIEKTTYDTCLLVARKAHLALRSEGVSRSDLIVDDDNNIYILELNTLPGMTTHSLVPKIAKAIGIPFTELIERILLKASLGLHVVEKG